MTAYRALRSLENMPGFFQEYGDEASYYVGKIVICALMIGVPALAALTAIVAAMLLDRLIIVAQPSWPQQSVSFVAKILTMRYHLYF